VIPIRDTVPRRHLPVVTWTLIAINVLVFLYELTLGPHQLGQLFYLFGIVPARYSHPAWAQFVGFPADDWWPFLTSMFLHGGWLHIIGNMWVLWIFGDNVEDVMGPIRYLLFYLVCGLFAGVTQWLTNFSATVPTIGASGAIAGVLGAYFVLFPRAKIVTLLPIFFWPFFVDLPAVFYLLMWFFLQLFSGAIAGLSSHVGGIAWWAHVGGFLFGALLCWWLVKRHRRPRRQHMSSA